MQYFLMKKDRLVYGTPAMEYCNDCLRDFVLAYEFQDERAYYYRKLLADFAVLKVELEGINHEGVLRCPKAKELTETNAELRRRYAELGCTLHPHKFSCQHYSKGVKFCGTTVKMQRVYVSQRTARSFRQSVAKFSAAPCGKQLGALLASINSYLGICKTRNGHHIAISTLELLNPKWNKYVHLDKRRMCLVANEGYTLHDRLRRKYKLRLKHNKHDKRGEAKRPAAHSRAQDSLAGYHGRE